MISVLEEQKKHAIEYIIEKLIKNYNYDLDKAKNAVLNSPYIELLNSDPEVVMHYDVNGWAEDIHEYALNKSKTLINS